MSYTGIYNNQNINNMNTQKTFPKKLEYRIVRRVINPIEENPGQKAAECENELNKLGLNGYKVISVVTLVSEDGDDIVEYLLMRTKPFFYKKNNRNIRT